MVWCNDHDSEKIFSFNDLKILSDKAANLFKSIGITKGDAVMLMLKRRWQYWICTLGLQKIGAISIPATVQLTKKDIIYRCNSASVKMIVSVSEDEIVSNIEAAISESPTVQLKSCYGKLNKLNWINFDSELEKASDKWERPAGTDFAGGN